MVYEIKLNSPKDVKVLSDAALDFDGNLTVSCGSTIIDARSLLALFTLIGRKNIKLVGPDHGDSDKFIKIIKQII